MGVQRKNMYVAVVSATVELRNTECVSTCYIYIMSYNYEGYIYDITFNSTVVVKRNRSPPRPNRNLGLRLIALLGSTPDSARENPSLRGKLEL